MNLDPKQMSDIIQKLIHSLPPSLQRLPQNLEKNFHEILQSGFNKMDLVTREEFDAQKGVLLRTREKLEALEAKLALWEAQQKAGHGKQ